VKFTGMTELFKYLAKQCGIGADVLLGGTIRMGDSSAADERPALR
jgi:hypothetical protein